MSLFSFRGPWAPALLWSALVSGPAAAFNVDLGDTQLRVENLFTVGASWRMQDRDASLIGKSSLNPGLCLVRTSGEPNAGANPDGGNTYAAGAIPAGCSTSNAGAMALFTGDDYRGSYNPNSDQGNLNFERGDIVHAAAKLTSDFGIDAYGFSVFTRAIYFFDANYSDFTQHHPDTTLMPATSKLPGVVTEGVGSDLDVIEYHVSRTFDIADRAVAVKIGNQTLNWGESSLLFLNSMNSINPPDATRARIPGFDLKEAFQPVGMVVMTSDVIENVGMEVFYQYEWKPVVTDPVGTFFSQSDTLGAGGTHAMLSQGRAPDDPLGLYRGIDTCSGSSCVDSAGLLGSTSSRTLQRDYAEEYNRRPDDGGQYGAALKIFLPNFNNGTEVALYFANYHSRLPIASFMAAQETCLVGGNLLASVVGCGIGAPGSDANNPMTPENEEPLPVDTARVVVEYPENIHMMGLSFNTTVGDFALSGEYAFRDNLPVQIHTTDLTFAALQPAFPTAEVVVAPGTSVPGRRQAVPDFVTEYRGGTAGVVEPGQYIAGYERLKVGQAGLTVLNQIGGTNPIGASQMTILLEMGYTQVFNMPGLSELQFNGGGTDTHISDGADGSIGINPRDVRDDPSDPASNVNAPGTHLNVTAHADLKGFGDAHSYGYRLLNLNRWDDALFGASIESLSIIQHDVSGTAPGIGTNFTHGRRNFAQGIRFDYLSTWLGEVRYTWFTGGGKRDGLRDRDNIFVTLGYQF